MENDSILKFKRKLKEEVSAWLKNEANYPEKGNWNLEFKECSVPEINGSINIEDIFKMRQTLISIEVIGLYLIRFGHGNKMNGYAYKWIINNLAVSWMNDDYEFNFENIEPRSHRLAQ